MADFLPFDSAARLRARNRAMRLISGRAQLLQHIEEELMARAEMAITLPEGPHLRSGLLLPPPQDAEGHDPSPEIAARYQAKSGLEDGRNFPDNQFALITSLMTLHGVNDLPGALILARRALKTGGRFVAALPAGFSAGSVREAFLEADIAAGGGVSPRVGPTLDPAEAAGLLQRAGFQEPVADIETLTLRYKSLADFARDARAHGDTGWLATRGRGLTTKHRWAMAEAAFAKFADADGRVPVEVQILYLAGKAG